MLPEILPAMSSSSSSSCCLPQLLRLWTEMKKNLETWQESLLRGNQREMQREKKQIDTVGDREWVRGRKLKGKKKGGGRKCTLQSSTVSPLPLPFVLHLFRRRFPFLSPLSRFPFFFSCVSAPLLFSCTSNSPQLYIWSCFGTTATSGPRVCRQKQQSKSSRYNEPSQEEGEAVLGEGGGMKRRSDAQNEDSETRQCWKE